MPELSLYDPALNPQLLRCILYCEFDPNLGPRPVFQSPDNFVSNEILDCLSDHLIASSELCGHSISSGRKPGSAASSYSQLLIMHM
ncbi:hypothetical protein T484DRAFT_1772200 [Baffinella frigidus]|nr:hypothetical protein T484DRAFT_1772200 [Cryptophyta sp. CCMP2293]